MALSESTIKLINERLVLLPEGIQHLINGQYLSDTLDNLVSKYDLGNGAARKLSNEIMLVLLCFTRRQELPQKLKKILSHYENAVVENILQTVDENIFSLVNSDIQSVWQSITNTDVEDELVQPKEAPPSNQNSVQIHSNNQNTTTTAPQTDPTLVAKQREDLLKEIEKAEEKLASIQPIRTMQTDYQHTTQPNDEPDEHNGATQSESVTRKTAPTDGTMQDDESPVHRTNQDDLLRKKPSTQQYATLTPTQDTAPRWSSDNS